MIPTRDIKFRKNSKFEVLKPCVTPPASLN